MMEVWIYKRGQWSRRGWLSTGQRATLRGGVIRCARDGSLLISTGDWFSASVVLPDGSETQLGPGRKPVHLPASSSITLWDGERGLLVRDADIVEDDTQAPSGGRRVTEPTGGRARLRANHDR